MVDARFPRQGMSVPPSGFYILTAADKLGLASADNDDHSNEWQ
jgi:hypothetical protein